MAPKDAEVLAALGMAQSLNGQVELAIATLNTALKLDPRNLSAMESLAIDLEHLGRNEEAEKDLRSGLAAYPGNELLINSLANLLADTHRYDEAISLFKAALTRNPQSIETLRDLAFTLYERAKDGDIDEAVGLANRLLKPIPNDHLAWHRLEMFLDRKGDYRESIGAYEKALQLAPASPGTLTSLLHTYARARDLQGAIKTFCRFRKF